MDLEKYLLSFDYEARKQMKIQIPELLELIRRNEAQFIDVRFREEFNLWNFPFSHNIPLNEMPNMLSNLDKNKLIVTACPHYDRAIIGKIFLMQKGFNARYLVEGLLGLADYLRGDNAKHFFDSINKED
ncbi:MAG: rhodanese-like domain-containing protein [Draconibacterium sp.]